uniref:Uncharacterized protein n=1 Tax=Planktothricoides sp. SpSt-374 TaxID=2282167 RepID=A0A7C3ZJK3_9CYAN
MSFVLGLWSLVGDGGAGEQGSSGSASLTDRGAGRGGAGRGGAGVWPCLSGGNGQSSTIDYATGGNLLK